MWAKSAKITSNPGKWGFQCLFKCHWGDNKKAFKKRIITKKPLFAIEGQAKNVFLIFMLKIRIQKKKPKER